MMVLYLVVKDPNLRPPGWSTATSYGLSRFLELVLGICWLLAVSLMINYLGEDIKPRQLWRRVLWSILLLGAVYGIGYGVTLLLKG